MGGFGGLHTALREQASFSSLAQSGQADCSPCARTAAGLSGDAGAPIRPFRARPFSRTSR